MQHCFKNLLKKTEDVASMMNHQHTVFLSGHSESTTKKAEYIKMMIWCFCQTFLMTLSEWILRSAGWPVKY